MLGVDRLDMIKGIPQKILAFEKFLEENPSWRDRVVLLQIAVPTRTDVPECMYYVSCYSVVCVILHGSRDFLRNLSLAPILFLFTLLGTNTILVYFLIKFPFLIATWN